MRTLHVGLRVSDLEWSLVFYTAVGYTVVGTVEEAAFGSLTMLPLPGDDFVTIRLVHGPCKGKVDFGTGLSHLVIPVEPLEAARADLAVKQIMVEPAGVRLYWSSGMRARPVSGHRSRGGGKARTRFASRTSGTPAGR